MIETIHFLDELPDRMLAAAEDHLRRARVS